MKNFNKSIAVIIVAMFAFLNINFSSHAQDVYELKFTANGTHHRAALILFSDDTGKMRVRFYSKDRTKMIEQYMEVQKISRGFKILGYNPTYAGTEIKCTTYGADNFYISRDEDGILSCVNVDDNSVTASCSIRAIEGYSTKQSFLSDFSWKIDDDNF
jgi:hypothetical protein